MVSTLGCQCNMGAAAVNMLLAMHCSGCTVSMCWLHAVKAVVTSADLGAAYKAAFEADSAVWTVTTLMPVSMASPC